MAIDGVFLQWRTIFTGHASSYELETPKGPTPPKLMSVLLAIFGKVATPRTTVDNSSMVV